MSVEIMPLQAELTASFHQAFDVVARERRYLTFLEAPPLDDTRHFVLDGEKKGDTRLVAVAHDEVVGWCDVSRYPFPTKAHRGTLGIGVLPAHRGRRIGYALLNTALEVAWRSGITRVELDVYTDNAPAIALYRKIGFEEVGIVRDAVRIEGIYRDALAMAMIRRAAAEIA